MTFGRVAGNYLVRLVRAIVVDDEKLPSNAGRDVQLVHLGQRLVEQLRPVPGANGNGD
jgi:hypothetical protein